MKRTTSLPSGFIAVVIGLGIVAAPPAARASGIVYAERGVRPMGRGGAFVAGADDLGAIWYNPAGLVDAGSALFFDSTLFIWNAEYARTTLVRDAAGNLGTYTYPTAKGTNTLLPVPTIAGSYAFGPRDSFVAAAGILAPYTPVAHFDSTVSGQPSGARYSLVSMYGTALVEAGLWLAWKPIEQLRVGIGAQLLAGTFATSVDFNSNPRDELLGASEAPAYDTRATMTVSPIVSPGGNAGVTFVPWPFLRVGVSGQLPYIVDAPATIKLQLPSAPEFQSATPNGQSAQVRFRIAPVVRAGVEARPTDALRVEATWVRELWGDHTQIEIDPKDIQLLNVTGFPSPFAVAPIVIPRHFKDSDSFRFGGEYAFEVLGQVTHVRAGVNFEQSAVPPAYVTALTIDSNKVTLGFGAGLTINKRVRLDFNYAHVFAQTVYVNPSEAAVPRVNPVRGNATFVEGANGGTYASRADLLGMGFNYKF